MKTIPFLVNLFKVSFFQIAGLAVLLVNAPDAKAQDHAAAHSSAKEGKADDTDAWKLVTKSSLSDSGLVNKEVMFLRRTLQPGVADTVAHRHPCEVFVYVQEGTLEYREGNNQSIFFKKGEMLHENLNSLHTLTRNPSKTEQTKLLLMFLYTKGKPTYVREYPETKTHGK